MSLLNRDNPEPPTLSEALQGLVKTMLTRVHTAIPGKVVEYLDGKATVEVQILQRSVQGTTRKYPAIPGVPVIFPRSAGGDAFLKIPIRKGDTGILLFAERSLDIWVQKGGLVDPEDVRTHDLNDAMFIPGLFPFNNAVEEADSSAVELVNDRAAVNLYPEGKLQLRGGENLVPPLYPSPSINLADPVEVLKLLIDLLSVLASARVLTPIGPAPFSPEVILYLNSIKAILQQVVK